MRMKMRMRMIRNRNCPATNRTQTYAINDGNNELVAISKFREQLKMQKDSTKSLRAAGKRTEGANRNKKGSALLELAAIAWVMPVAAVIAVNVGLLVFGAYINDAACRDAVRAASQQTNASDARAAALRAIKPFATASNVVSSPEILLTGDNFVFEPFLDDEGKPQTEKGPYVKVTSRLSAKLPCPVIFTVEGPTDKIEFKQSYIFPLLNPNQGKNSSAEFDYSDLTELILQQQAAEATAIGQAANEPLEPVNSQPVITHSAGY